MPHPPEAAPTLRHRLEHALVRGVLRLAAALPDGAAEVAARGLGGAIRLALPKRVALARAQMAAALGRPADDPQIIAWANACFTHFTRLPFELLHALHALKTRPVGELIEFVDRHHLDAALARGRGVILVTGHFGNWEVFGLCSRLLGVPLTAVARPMKNRLLDDELNELRGRHGQKIVSKEGAGLPLSRALKAGGAIALLIDQHAGSRGLRVPFFHADASTFTLPVALSRRFGALILPTFGRAVGNHRFETRFEAPLELDPSLPDAEDDYRVTLAFHRRLEAAIRAEPGQYLWFHRRWKRGGTEPDPRWRERYAAPR